MGAADDIALAARRRNAVVRRALAARRAQQRKFWIGVACATVLHAALFVSFSASSSLRRIGEPDASPEGISVELVDVADFMSQTTIPAQQESAPPSLAQPPPPPAATEPPPPTPSPPVPEPNKAVAIEKAPDPVSRPEPPTKQSTSLPAKTKTALAPPLDLRLPDASFAPMGRSAAFSRPPGITRSGENDEFGRGVIAALRRTMPANNARSQVTIRLLLSDKGNLIEVRLIRSGGDPILDQNVLFAVKQSNFPIPPVGSTEVDRAFMVTYIYQ
jgi:periplasmic protein TonB